MIITKKALPRRTVLRGLGATLALPLLDGMVPGALGHPQHAGRRHAPLRRAVRAERYGDGVLDAARSRYRLAFELSPILRPMAPHRGSHARR